MLALGALLVGGALLAIVILAPVFRRPEPPRWMRWALAAELVTVAIVSVLALGVGYVGAGAIQAWQQGVDPVQIALFLASTAVVLAAWRGLNARTRRRAGMVRAAPEAGTGALAAAGGATTANDAGEPSPPKRPQPRRAA